MPIEIKSYMCSYCGEMFDDWRECYNHEHEKHDCAHCKNVEWTGPGEFECSKNIVNLNQRRINYGKRTNIRRKV